MNLQWKKEVKETSEFNWRAGDSQTVSLPVFFFFSEGRGESVQALDTSGLERNLMWYPAAYLDSVY